MTTVTRATAVVWCFLTSANGFTPPILLPAKTTTSATTTTRTSSSTLSLVPSQGSQLEAAFNAACCNKNAVDDDDDDDDYYRDSSSTTSLSATTTTTIAPPAPPALRTQALTAARAFVSRVFSKPSSLLHPLEEEDVVLYPIIGFRLCASSSSSDKKGLVALPTISNASCRILPLHQQVYGWYSPACHLDQHHPQKDNEDESELN